MKITHLSNGAAAQSRCRAAATSAALLLALCLGAGAQAPAKTSVVGTVHLESVGQTLTGFGGSLAYYQDWLPAQPYKQELYDALFSGLGLSILRLQNGYRYQKQEDFDPATAEIVRAATRSLGRPVTVLMTSWSPPAALKSNGSENGGGTLARDATGAFVYGKFADYWRDSILAYRKIGVDPTYITLQNELDFKADYASCLFQPAEQTVKGVDFAGYDKALDAVYHELQALPAPPKILGPETFGVGYHSVQSYLDPKNTSEMGELYGVAHHLYTGGDQKQPDSFIPDMRALRARYTVPLFQTEFGRGNGLQTAWLIHNALVEEQVSGYCYWALAWPGDQLVVIDNPWKRAEWKYPHGYHLTPSYYAMKHFAYFTRPGDRRVEAETTAPAIKMSAFLSPDHRRLVVVLINTSGTETSKVRLRLGGFSGKRSEVYRSTPDAAVAPELWKSLGALGPDSAVSLPPQSISTVSIRRP